MPCPYPMYSGKLIKILLAKPVRSDTIQGRKKAKAKPAARIFGRKVRVASLICVTA